MNYALFVVYLLALFNIGYTLAKHGESRKDDTHNIWITLLAQILTIVLFGWAVGWRML